MSTPNMTTFPELMEQLKSAESSHPFVNAVAYWLLEMNRTPDEVENFTATSDVRLNLHAIETIGLPLVYDVAITFKDGVAVQKRFDIRPDLPAILRDLYKFSQPRKEKQATPQGKANASLEEIMTTINRIGQDNEFTL